MTESTPLAISNHSLSISLRSLIAPMICRTPVAIAHPAMNSSRTSAVMPGSKYQYSDGDPQEPHEREPPTRRWGAAHNGLRDREHAVTGA